MPAALELRARERVGHSRGGSVDSYLLRLGFLFCTRACGLPARHKAEARWGAALLGKTGRATALGWRLALKGA